MLRGRADSGSGVRGPNEVSRPARFPLYHRGCSMLTVVVGVQAFERGHVLRAVREVHLGIGAHVVGVRGFGQRDRVHLQRVPDAQLWDSDPVRCGHRVHLRSMVLENPADVAMARICRSTPAQSVWVIRARRLLGRLPSRRFPRPARHGGAAQVAGRVLLSSPRSAPAPVHAPGPDAPPAPPARHPHPPSGSPS